MAEAETNEIVMRRYCLSWRSADYVTMVDTWADDIVVHIPGRHPFAGTYKGKNAVLDISVKLQKAASRHPISIHDWLTSDRHAAVLASERAVHAGTVLDANRIYLFHLAGGKIVELWVCEEDQAAVNAFYTEAAT